MDDTGDGTAALVYSSRAAVGLDERELEMLLGRSRERNAAAGITGLLLHVHTGLGAPSYFIQLLEGPPAAVGETFARIEQDDLHDELRVLRRTAGAERLFGAWSMALEDLDPAGLALLGGHDPARDATPVGELVADPAGVDAVVRHYARR